MRSPTEAAAAAPSLEARGSREDGLQPSRPATSRSAGGAGMSARGVPTANPHATVRKVGCFHSLFRKLVPRQDRSPSYNMTRSQTQGKRVSGLSGWGVRAAKQALKIEQPGGVPARPANASQDAPGLDTAGAAGSHVTAKAALHHQAQRGAGLAVPSSSTVVSSTDSTSTAATLIPTQSRVSFDKAGPGLSETGVSIRLESYSRSSSQAGCRVGKGAVSVKRASEIPEDMAVASRQVSSSDGSASSATSIATAAAFRAAPFGLPASLPGIDPFRDSLWDKDSLGSLYVFQGSKVPGLLEIFTARDSPDFPKVTSWIARWFASDQGRVTIDPVILPVVFHVTDISKADAGANSRPRNGLEQRRFTERRLAYEREWEASSHTDQAYSGVGSCVTLNGEYISLKELIRRQKLGFIAPRSRSRGLLKVLLADPTTVVITFEPLRQIQHMIGKLVANIALVACGGTCTEHGHDASGAETYHNTVLDLQQVQMAKKTEGQLSYHVAGLNVSRPPGERGSSGRKKAVGLVIWITHGYVDTTPIAVGYCGFAHDAPREQQSAAQRAEASASASASHQPAAMTAARAQDR